MRKHLAIFNHQAIVQIFSGKKVIESRFSQRKIAPFGQVSMGDIVYIKPPGEEIVGEFKVKKVVFLEGLEEEDWKFIKRTYGKLMSFGKREADLKYFQDHIKAEYGTIIFISEVEKFLTSPVKISKKDLRGWVVLQ